LENNTFGPEIHLKNNLFNINISLIFNNMHDYIRLLLKTKFLKKVPFIVNY